jgi:hypothetical protein
MNKHYLQHREIGAMASPDKTTRTLRAGDPTQSKLKIVCESCNSGWLSRMQQRAKRHLIPLIRGEKTALGKEAQEAIAAWCAMATMTGDYLHHDATAVAITQGERDWFRDNLTPPCELENLDWTHTWAQTTLDPFCGAHPRGKRCPSYRS